MAAYSLAAVNLSSPFGISGALQIWITPDCFLAGEFCEETDNDQSCFFMCSFYSFSKQAQGQPYMLP